MSIAADHPLAWLVARPIAHRGLHDKANGIIENSVSAFAAAVAHGYAIECDVQLSMDGDAVVFHDFGLGRLTGLDGSVIDHSADELKEMTLKGSSDRIATLERVLGMVSNRVPLVIEVKSRFDGSLALAKRVAEIIAGREAPIAVKSFDPAVVAYLADVAPHVPRGFIGMNAYDYPDFAHLSDAQKRGLATLGHFDAMRPDFLSWKVGDLAEAAPLFEEKAPALPVMSWTVRSAEDQATALRHAEQIVFEGFLP